MMSPNQAPGCVKSVGVNFGNDQIFDMARFDELSRTGWSEIEFLHRLALERTGFDTPVWTLLDFSASLFQAIRRFQTVVQLIRSAIHI